MRTIVEFTERGDDLPLLQFYIHQAPHRRQHHRVIEEYRRELVEAAQSAKIAIPITQPVAISALFINPCSPDLDNLVMALFRALDGKGHAKPTILKDDGLVNCLEKVAKFYPEKKRDFAPKSAQLASVAQQDRAPGSELGGRRIEACRERQYGRSTSRAAGLALKAKGACGLGDRDSGRPPHMEG